MLCASARLQPARGCCRGNFREQLEYCSKERKQNKIFSFLPHTSTPGASLQELHLMVEEAEGKHWEWAALSPGPATSESRWACSISCKCPPGPASPSCPPAEPSTAIPAHTQRRLHHNCFLNSEAFEVKAKVCFYA